jgi:hypothetical protein
MKQAQLAARKAEDPALTRQIAELAARLAAYTAPVSPPEKGSIGLVTLKKKTAEGTVVPTAAG